MLALASGMWQAIPRGDSHFGLAAEVASNRSLSLKAYSFKSPGH